MFPRSTWSNLKSLRENLFKLFWLRGSKLPRVRAVKCPIPGQRCSTSLPDNLEIGWMDVCSKLIRVLSPNLVRSSGERHYRRLNSDQIMTPIFSYLHNTDCLSNLLSHSDLSKSGKNTRARITCQNIDQNFTSAPALLRVWRAVLFRNKAKPGLLPSAIYSLSRYKGRHHKNFSDCTFYRLKLKWVMTG